MAWIRARLSAAIGPVSLSGGQTAGVGGDGGDCRDDSGQRGRTVRLSLSPGLSDPVRVGLRQSELVRWLKVERCCVACEPLKTTGVIRLKQQLLVLAISGS